MGSTSQQGPAAGSVAIDRQAGAIFMAVAAPVVVIDAAAKIALANGAFLGLCRLGAAEVIGLPIGGLLVPRDRATPVSALETRLAAPVAAEVPGWALRRDGTRMPVRLVSSPLDRPGLAACRVITVLPDEPASAEPDGERERLRPLVQVTERGGLVAAGPLKLIAFDEIKAALGDRWARQSERALDAAERIIRRHLRPDDTFVRTHDDGFLICFAERLNSDAPQVGARIIREIRQHLIGEWRTDAAPKTAGPQGGGPQGGGTTDLLGDESQLFRLLEGRIVEHGREIDRRAQDDVLQGMQRATLEPEPVFDRDGRPVPITFAALPKPLTERIAAALVALPDAVAGDVDLDTIRLTLTSETILADIDKGSGPAYLVPLDFEVFQSRRRHDRLIRICRGLRPQVRERIIFMLSNIPKVVSQSRLQEVFQLLKPFSKGVGIEAADLDRAPWESAEYRVPLLAFDAAILVEAARSGTHRVERLARQRKLLNARVIARQVRGQADLKIVGELGVDLVSYAAGREADEAPSALPLSWWEAGGAAAAFEAAAAALFLIDATHPGFPIVLVNHALATLTGWEPERIVGQSFDFLRAADTEPAVLRDVRKALERNQPLQRELLIGRREAGPLWAALDLQPYRGAEGVVLGFAGMLSDITERRKSASERRNLAAFVQTIADSMPGYIFQRAVLPDGTVTYPYISPSLGRLVGLPPSTPITFELLRELVHPEDRARVAALLARPAADLAPQEFEYRLLRVDGGIVWIRSLSRPVKNRLGETVWTGVGLDITSLKAAETEVSHLHDHDPATGLLNRDAFRRELSHRILALDQGSAGFAVFEVGLTTIAEIETAFGTAITESVLREMVARFAALAGADGAVARLGTDKFGIAVPQIDGRRKAASTAVLLWQEATRPVPGEDRTLKIDARVGGALALRGAFEKTVAAEPAAEELLKQAGIACQEAAASRPVAYAIYTSDISDRLRRNTVLRLSIHQALEKNELELRFQPIVALESGRIVGAEALLRWNEPTLGVQSADRFLPIANELGLLAPIGSWALEEALRELARWPEGGPRVAINVAESQLRRGDFLSLLATAIAREAVQPARIELDFAEEFLVEMSSEMSELIRDIRATGVAIAVDDYGPNEAAFPQLRKLPLDRVKLDPVPIRRLRPGEADTAELREMIALAQGLGYEVVAKGVETEFQRDFLRTQGCTLGQGWLFSQPITAEELRALLRDGRTLPAGLRGDADAA